MLRNNYAENLRVETIQRFDDRVERHRNRIALQSWDSGRTNCWTYGDLQMKARQLCGLLIRLASDAEKVVLISESRPEWALGMFGILRSGKTLVPVDPLLTAEEIQRILEHSQAGIVLVSEKYADKIDTSGLSGRIVLRLEDTLSALTFGEDADPNIHRSSDVAMIVYTSGTTGAMKGVELSFLNVLSHLDAVASAMKVQPEQRFLSILPLNHLFELVLGLLTPLNSGASITYVGSLLPSEILSAMNHLHITDMIGVPPFYSALKKSIESKKKRWPPLKRRTAIAIDRVAPKLPLKGMKKLMYLPIHKALGYKLERFYSGGAPLDPVVATYFDHMGLPIFQGYGLTETSPVVAFNRPSRNRYGTVGLPLEILDIRIVPKKPGDKEGEIQVKGPSVMKGYHRDPKMSADVFTEDGYFKTGDLGSIDKDGFLSITGRSKSLIVLAGGKKVYPEEVDSIVNRIEGIQESAVFGIAGTRGEEVCAVVLGKDTSRLRNQPEVEEELRNRIKHECRTLASYKRPTRIVFVDEPLPRTPTRKVKVFELREKISKNLQFSTLH